MSQHVQIYPGVNYRLLLASALLTLILSSNAMAQTTVFTYQGKLTDAGNPATGTYDMQFKAFDSADIATGNQIGTTVDRLGIPVTSGIFTVELDFGPGVFDGSARFLEIGVRPADSANPFTVLGPRQPLAPRLMQCGAHLLVWQIRRRMPPS